MRKFSQRPEEGQDYPEQKDDAGIKAAPETAEELAENGATVSHHSGYIHFQQYNDAAEVYGVEGAEGYGGLFHRVVAELEKDEQDDTIEYEREIEPQQNSYANAFGFIACEYGGQDCQSCEDQGKCEPYYYEEAACSGRMIAKHGYSCSDEKGQAKRKGKTRKKACQQPGAADGLRDQQLYEFGSVVQVDRGEDDADQRDDDEGDIQQAEKAFGSIVLEIEYA